jgi:hypothetical protein
MALFRRNDISAQIAAARASLADTNNKIEVLSQTKAERLLDADDLDTVVRIDDEIAALRKRSGLFSQRISALDGQLRQEQAERREAARANAIRIIERKLRAREALAGELEASIKRTGDLFFALLNSPSVAGDWPWSLPSSAAVDVDVIRKEVGWALFSAGRPVNGRTIFPNATNAGLGVAGTGAAGIAQSVASRSAQLVELLRSMPLGDDAEVEADVPAENVPPRGLSELATA